MTWPAGRGRVRVAKERRRMRIVNLPAGLMLALQTVVRVAADKPAVIKRAEELLVAMKDER